MKIKKLVTIGVTAVVLVGGTAGGIHFYKSYQSKKLVAPVIPVADINWGYWGDSETSYGMVTNNSAQEVYLDDAEDVEKIFVKQGDEVKKGDPLVKYDISEVEADIKHKELELAAQENDIAKETRELEALRQIVPVADPVEHDDEDDVWDEWDTREAQIEKLEEELMNLESLPETDERDSRIYNYVTEDSVPYNVETADGSAERPYIYYCNKDAYAYGSFFNSIRPKKKKDGTMTEGKHVRFIICKKDGKGQMLLKEDVPPQDAVPEIKNDQEQTIDQLEKPSRRPEKEEEKPKKDEEKPKKDKEEAKKENEELKNAQVEKKKKGLSRAVKHR